MRHVGESLASFARFHVASGARLFLFFDDPGDPQARDAASWPQTRAMVCDDEHWGRVAQLVPDAAQVRDSRWLRTSGTPQCVMLRQTLNATLALELARETGVNWVLHVDADELVSGDLALPEFFARADTLGLGLVRLLNHEAVAHETASDPFATVRVFKKPTQLLTLAARSAVSSHFSGRCGYFLAYSNGKSAVRVVPGVSVTGVHGFALPPGSALGSAVVSNPAILHYPYSTYEAFARKHRRMGGDFHTGDIFGAPWSPPPILASARDLVSRDDERGLRALYERCVLLSEFATEALLAAGALAIIDEPARVLASDPDEWPRGVQR